MKARVSYVFLGGLEHQLLQLVQAVVDAFSATSLNHRLLDLRTQQQSCIGVARILSAGVHFFYHPAKTPKN